MTTKSIFTLTTLILAAHAGLSSTASRAETDSDLASNRLRWNREELHFLSDVDPFPEGDIPAIDPLSRKRVSGVLVGPAFRTRAHGSDYNYYRYVTFYNVRERKERIENVSIIRELCHNKGEHASGITISSKWSASVSASATLKGLGLSSTLTKEKSFSFTHSISVTPGVIANHTAYYLIEDKIGRTHIQLLNSKTRKTEFLKKETRATQWWHYALFPLAAHLADRGKYPMDFKVKDAERTFIMERDIIGTCDNGFGV